MLTSDLFSLPTLGYVAITLAFILMVKSLVKPTYPSNIPPFPARPYPILGHLPYVMKGQRISEYLKALAQLGGRPKDVSMLTRTSVSNNICSIIVGKRFDYQDPFLIAFIESFQKQAKAGENFSPVVIWPWLRHIPGNFLNSKTLNREIHAVIEQFCDKFIEQVTKNEDDMPECFISQYWKEMNKMKAQGKSTTLNVENLRWSLYQLFFAGTDTTSTTIMWYMYFMLRHPHIQKKVYHELSEVVGVERAPDLQDKAKLNYFWATVMETQRLASILPQSVPHLCIADVTIQGYTIPAETVVLPNLDAVMLDENTWEEPQKFRPERFLDDTGALIKPDSFMPFSVGRRMCLGEALANTELFLYISALIQRFELQPSVEGQPPEVSFVEGVICPPGRFEVRFIERAASETA
ncbi:cytochrome p450 2u1 [Plakobranchus ocellatus]|uniref:Cytochrome p450 2u1 n=1 Tax=Plakobranchus ocellatus TaxID=259542 RepID=A0AAV3XTI4_9GAST|nr:cytochrome p450 2u1 [Plakobranchus ocellatus]